MILLRVVVYILVSLYLLSLSTTLITLPNDLAVVGGFLLLVGTVVGLWKIIGWETSKFLNKEKKNE